MKFIALSNMSIRKQLNVIIMAISSIAVLLTSTAFFAKELISIRQSMVDEITTVALIIASNSSGALSFRDKESASKTLAAIKAERHIVQASIFDASGSFFAHYSSDKHHQKPVKLLSSGGHNHHPMVWDSTQVDLIKQGNGYYFTRKGLFLAKPILFHDENIGTVFLQADNTFLSSAMVNFLVISSIFVVLILLVSFLGSSRLQKLFSDPVIELAKAMGKVSSDKDYSLRVSRKSKDELGSLYMGFNGMLEQIQKRDNKLHLTQYSIDHTGDAAYWMDASGRFFYVNYAAEKIVGMTRQELLSCSMIDIDPSMTPEKWQQFWDVLKVEGSVTKETCLQGKEGRCIPVEMNANYVEYAGQSFNCAMIRNISGRKRLEEQLKQSEKMKAVGTLAAGVAHDLNNILSGVVTYPELLLLDLPPESNMRRPLEAIRKSGNKAAAIIQDMLTLTRRGVADSKVASPNAIISEYLNSPEFAELQKVHPFIELDVRLAPDLSPVNVSSVHLSKTIMNLLVNAYEAIEESGKIKVASVNRIISAPLYGYEEIPEGEYAVLSIEDTGIGIPEKDLNRIFEPFYSRKKMGRSGTGLGMTVVYTSVKDYEGFLDLRTEVGKGTRFDLYFPAATEEIIEEEKAADVTVYRGDETVLVVDDVPEQRDIASTMLGMLGYKVATAESGECAMDFLQNNEIDIVVLDMIMAPGINGLETYKRISKLYPGQKAVIASGFADSELVAQAQQLGAGEYVKKPYSMEELGLALRRELAKET
jgi:PAS domain S-box-containing protein